ncbi:phosphoserine phosphatase [Bacillus coahuilensis m2-6]|uniref:PP2C family serine/threonine-protein phosphatase n=1 Tax=Bacillus coahuilensis TaxID=408580 RepID=UPI000494A0A0|nr:PP2C family serine/threonine-protein phosphatase [Bacillus coahuilensis]KUP04458.1 phosphoserine phosphatase [Bacillus coahuilensis m2-6]
MSFIHTSQIEALVEQRSKGNNSYCGDSYFMKATDDFFICVLADGLGSGKFANESSEAVATVVETYYEEDLHTLMEMCNKVLLHKRGAAVAILKVYFESNVFDYICVGNIRFYLYSPKGKLTYPLPVSGYLSGRPQRFKVNRFSFEPKSKFVLHSDGITASNIKSILSKSLPLPSLAEDIMAQQNHYPDDSTMIMGSLH